MTHDDLHKSIEKLLRNRSPIQYAHRGRRPARKVKLSDYDSMIRSGEHSYRLRAIAKRYKAYRQAKVWRDLGTTIAADIHALSNRQGFLRRFISKEETV